MIRSNKHTDTLFGAIFCARITPPTSYQNTHCFLIGFSCLPFLLLLFWEGGDGVAWLDPPFFPPQGGEQVFQYQQKAPSSHSPKTNSGYIKELRVFPHCVVGRPGEGVFRFIKQKGNSSTKNGKKKKNPALAGDCRRNKKSIEHRPYSPQVGSCVCVWLRAVFLLGFVFFKSFFFISFCRKGKYSKKS